MTREEVLDKLIEIIKLGEKQDNPMAGSLRKLVAELDGQPSSRQAVVLSVIGASLEANQLGETGCSNLLFSVAVLVAVGEESLGGCLLNHPLEVAMQRLDRKSKSSRTR
jgi:hypothetical protein